MDKTSSPKGGMLSEKHVPRMKCRRYRALLPLNYPTLTGWLRDYAPFGALILARKKVFQSGSE
jgi:hypothetical protein